VLIQVAYAGVNRHDCTQRKRGTPPPGATDVFGLEVSGTIVAASADVPGTRIGQRVCALINGGGYADYCVAEAALALEYPASLSEAEAAALPEALFTFWFNVFELGGLKADGPPMDADLLSYVGAFRVPYVHGLTMGELARMTKDAPEAPGRHALTDAQRTKGKLTVIPMRGWTRSMRWTETGLTWIPTSPLIADFEAVKGYPMTGLGCELGGFKHGVGSQYQFRGVLHLTTKIDVYEKELRALNLPGIDFRRVSAPNTKTGKAGTGLYIEIRDYDAWRPTELNFHLMRLACKLEPRNPFTFAPTPQRSLFLNLLGSRAFFNDLAANGKNTDIERWLKQWREQAKIYQQQSQKYWLYR